MVKDSVQGDGSLLTYKQFKELPSDKIKIGMIVRGISPSRLFATQNWVDATKIGNALNNPVPPEETLTIPTYVSSVPIKGSDRFQRVLVLGDFHHHTLYEWEMGKKVDAKIVGSLPPKNHISFSVLRQRASLPFRSLV